jgi:hypothetical protein
LNGLAIAAIVIGFLLLGGEIAAISIGVIRLPSLAVLATAVFVTVAVLLLGRIGSDDPLGSDPGAGDT